MQNTALTTQFKTLLDAVPRVDSRGNDHAPATRMWIALSRWQQEEEVYESRSPFGKALQDAFAQ